MIHCDNKQTVDLINKTVSLISTKLHHVNIYQHWLCKHIQNKIFAVEKLSINQILADSLMQFLSCQKHENFLQLLRILNLFFLLNILMILHLKMIFFQIRIQSKKNNFFELKSAFFLYFKKTILHLKKTLLQLKKTLF